MNWFLLTLSLAGFVHCFTAQYFNNGFIGQGQKYIPRWWHRVALAIFFATMSAIVLRQILTH